MKKKNMKKKVIKSDIKYLWKKENPYQLKLFINLLGLKFSTSIKALLHLAKYHTGARCLQ